MPDKIEATSEVKETDIVFDCPHCGKSLAIDYRGAGLTIPCSDCGNYVEVPIPEGMDIVDLDSSEEEQELRILNLRRALSSAELRIHRLEEELESIIARREALEQHRTANLNREKVIRDNTDTLKKALVDLTRATEAILQSVTAGPAE
jgi:hypothetical protein